MSLLRALPVPALPARVPLRAPSRTRIAGVALLAGAIGFLAIERIAVWSYPGFDPSLQPLSGLGNLGAPTRSLWIAAMGLLAASWVIAAAIVVRPAGGRIVLTLNLLPVVGILVALAVPLDANLAVHELAAFVALVTGNLAMVANAERLRRPWRVTALLLAAGALAAMSPAAAFLVGRVGWGTLERIVVAPLLAAQVAFGLALLLGGLAAELGSARRSGRRTLALLAGATVLAVAGVGTGISAGGETVVAAELSRAVDMFLVAH
jgi:hypothetical membrane protein